VSEGTIFRDPDVHAANTYYWSTKAIAWGFDSTTGEHVAFAVPLEQVDKLRECLETEKRPQVSVDDVDILFIRPAGEPPA
jgi:hypothetical protein